MINETNPHQRLWRLLKGMLSLPGGPGRIVLAFAYGILCHLIFAAAVGAMIAAMFFGMSESFGNVPYPWAIAVNSLLIIQFPIMHSLLLTARGGRILQSLAPKGTAKTLSTTTYAIVASFQLLLLFAFWTPTGIIWWRAEGMVFYLICAAYTLSWLLLIKASYDAGAEVQSGALGWMSLAQDKRPVFPDMPTGGLFKFIRQPIYVSFALTTWTVPVWTPDQLVLATSLTAYCLLAPILKERRFKQRYGKRFEAYRRLVPYAVPKLRK
ncbi:MAG: isoprenylcysteine carboxylmethyltransferase family protein [Pseudomonadota bacterium]